jgi:Uma2 family endonuclease
VEGHPEIRLAPDALVAFGRPKGDRGSYLQWLERGVAPQVVFEALSPRNRAAEMERKRAFYERHGAEEYYEYDPDRGWLRGWIRRDDVLEAIPEMRGWRSPRLGVRFDLIEGELALYRPDGRRFATYVELEAEREHERRQAEHERQRAEHERQRAEHERRRAERLAAQLRALGVEPDDGP